MKVTLKVLETEKELEEEKKGKKKGKINCVCEGYGHSKSEVTGFLVDIII